MNKQSSHLSANKARAGSIEHVVRYVLIISLLLAIVAMAVLLVAR